jgi:nucleotide-binding universal stress UspA family protein
MTVKTILVAYDFSEPSARALALANDLAGKLGAVLHVAHIHPDVYDGRGEPALGIPWPSAGQEERYIRFLDTELQRLVTSVVGAGAEAVVRHIVRGDPVHRLLVLAEETKADMLCVGSTGRSGVERVLLGSVSQTLIRKAKLPVLTVH